VVAVVALLVSLALAGVVSRYASTDPDGLTRVAADHGFADQAGRHATDRSPLADYQVTGADEAPLSRGAAGVVGALVVLVAAAGLTYGVRRRTPTGADKSVDSS
jgi:hypothetical protein